MTRRAGTSLIEVLVTIGILGIGLTSVIALFPMAAITLGQALRDDRTATCAGTADGLIRDIHQRSVVEAGANSQEPYFTAMDGNQSLNAADCHSLSWADGVNQHHRSRAELPGVRRSDGLLRSQWKVGWRWRRNEYPACESEVHQRFRRDISEYRKPALALRLCSQMDGLTYDDDGAVNPLVTPDKRELRYNWLWVVQRPVNRDRYSATLRVVVFDRRIHMYAPPGLEAVYSVTFTPTTTSITNVPATADVRKGSWVMDGTMNNATPASATSTIRHANFYRVLSVTDLGTTPATYALELNTPIFRIDGGTAAYTGTLLVMPGIADVYRTAHDDRSVTDDRTRTSNATELLGLNLSAARRTRGRTMIRQTRIRSGTTLVELLVAAAMSIMIMWLLTWCYQQGLASFSNTKAHADLMDQERMVTSVMTRDLLADHFLNDSSKPNGGHMVRDQRLDLTSPTYVPPKSGFFYAFSPAGSIEGVDGDTDGFQSSISTNHILQFTSILPGGPPEQMFNADVPFGTVTTGPTYGRAAEISYFLVPTGQTLGGTQLNNLMRRQRLCAFNDRRQSPAYNQILSWFAGTVPDPTGGRSRGYGGLQCQPAHDLHSGQPDQSREPTEHSPRSCFSASPGDQHDHHESYRRRHPDVERHLVRGEVHGIRNWLAHSVRELGNRDQFRLPLRQSAGWHLRHQLYLGFRCQFREDSRHRGHDSPACLRTANTHDPANHDYRQSVTLLSKHLTDTKHG